MRRNASIDEQLASLSHDPYAETDNVNTLWPDERPWPTLSDDALYGLAGDIVRTIAPQTEADPAGLLGHVLLAFGAFVGPGPYVEVEATRHPARLFALFIGETSNGRKGTTRDQVYRVFRIADEMTLDAIRESGAASGEGLLEHFADRRDDDGNVISTPTEKRALWHEPEFARVLAISGREGATISARLRELWETGDVSNKTRKNPLKIRGAHLCFSADITPDEFNEKMPGLEAANGLLNRILPVVVKRSKFLPFGGELTDRDRDSVARRLRHAIDVARTRQRLAMTAEAREIYAPWYCNPPKTTGLLGAATGRREAQVIRLALTYALLDCCDAIDAPHLCAAIAFWDYSFGSARHVFGSRLGDPAADRLLRELRDSFPRGLTGREIDECMGKSLRPGKLQTARDDLESRNLIRSQKEETGGRPSIRWFAIPKPDKVDNGGQSQADVRPEDLCPVNPVCPEDENAEAPDGLFLYAKARLGVVT